MEINGGFCLLKKIGTQNRLGNIGLQERMGELISAKMKGTIYKLPGRNLTTISINYNRS
jgi:hypothetical protein